MGFTIALLARRNRGCEIYAAALNGCKLEELAKVYGMPVHEVQEQLDATRLALQCQVRVEFNRQPGVFN